MNGKPGRLESARKSLVRSVIQVVRWAEPNWVLENDKGEQAYQTRSSPQGIFQFPKVAVGKYKLVGTGVAKNRPRRVEAEVEIKDQPARPIRLQLQAK